MNTKWTKLISILLLTTMLILAVGCGDDDITGPDVTDLFGTWSQTGVTLNDVEADLAEFFDWSQGTVGVHMTLNEDSTYNVNEFNASNTTLYEESGTLTINGSGIIVTATNQNGTVINPLVVFDGTWAIIGDTLVLTTVEDLITVVITLTKVV